MKMNHNLAATILMSLASGTVMQSGPAGANRYHRDRAPPGSPLEQQRISEGAARRAAKLARRAARAGA